MSNNFGVTLTNATSVDRSKKDFYPTPSNVTEALMEVVNLSGCRVLEPACGQMHMVDVLMKYAESVDYFDKYDTYSGKLGDFLESKNNGYDWIITNPPFNLSVEFIEHALQEHKCNVALLLKSQYWHSAKRKGLFDKHKPKGVYPLTWRPDFHFGSKGGSPTMDVIWVVWNNTPSEFTEYQPLSRPK